MIHQRENEQQPLRGRQLRRLRHRARALVDGLGLPPAYDITILCRRIGARRGRPIHLVPLTMYRSGLSGLWISTHDADLVVYEASTSASHQHHIIAHECAHMLCGHDGVQAVDDEVARLLFPDLDPALVQQMLTRAGYPHHHEQEAEVVATVLLERLSRAEPEETGCIPAKDAVILARIDRSLRGG